MSRWEDQEVKKTVVREFLDVIFNCLDMFLSDKLKDPLRICA